MTFSNYDNEQSKVIKEILSNDYKQYDSEHGINQKLQTIGNLLSIVRTWIADCGRIEGKDEETIRNSGGSIFTIGSYKLGVNGPTSDIDALCVAP